MGWVSFPHCYLKTCTTTWCSVLASEGAWNRAAALEVFVWLPHLLSSLSESLCHQSRLATWRASASHGLACSFHSLDTLVVGGPRDLNVTLTVRNQGEDSYRTQVTFFYPPGLSYRRMSVTQVVKSFSGSDFAFLVPTGSGSHYHLCLPCLPEAALTATMAPDLWVWRLHQWARGFEE